MKNISDCSIREYQSVVATITDHQAMSPGLNQGSACHPPYILTYKDGLFQLRYCSTITSFYTRDHAWYHENTTLHPHYVFVWTTLLIECNVHISWKYTHGSTRVEVHAWKHTRGGTRVEAHVWNKTP